MTIKITNARDAALQPRDILIENGVIVSSLSGAPDLEIDGTSYLVTPALVDPHAHLREPGQEEKEDLESGLGAAVAGGFGSVVCMPNTKPVLDSPEIVKALIEKAERLGLARLMPSAALTRGQEGKLLSDAAALNAAGAVMLTDDGRTNEDAGVLRRGLEYAQALGLVVSVHAEDASLRGDGVMNEGAVSERLGLPGNPVAAEAARIARDLEIVAMTGARLHVQHLSSARGLALVRDAKKRGLPVTCEVAPHHLTLTDATLESFDAMYKVAPPLRTQADCGALLAGMLDGTVDCIGTDHAPHTKAEKERDLLEAPFGIANIELTFPLLYTRFVHTGKLELTKLLELMTVGPAHILGLKPPTLEVGAPADIALFDLETERLVDPSSFRTKARFGSPWAGESLRGWAAVTIVRGKVAFDVRG
ncbi:MAG: dihydroorotase [Pleurocapsa sp. SU_196_0]|nr:dihydroorotase [Pleurocapsa sp. SU_196_0]